VAALRPLGTRARKAADWQKTLIVRSEPFAVPPVILPHKHAAHSAGTLGLSSEAPERNLSAMTVYLQVHTNVNPVTPTT